ncbi:5-formyltetrahydrofolate cyclo-ligase [Anaerococcus degeneri]|uniref:5-formyltetrahydrofolate cyclo-ligase n=1 Tax=Anaerococcus degeneri TaxID=361500 RepID=A0ABS7YXF7_9FIRM|nr:5-formyltetrahydrofolate cyclo-ligase [Anaerococcus degeneri]MBP2015983.1 5-formyltetrahydrofolate cyclo-ligase [Anaerococcus degeneri]MCA2095729.1 5-formyltetrahydrofolate cyclo-ligase [Anaerococcus degeneri]
MKSEFRRFFLNLRREMEEDCIKENSEKIIENLLASDFYKNSQSIFVYVSKNKEVETKDFIKKAIADGKKIYVPKIKDHKMFAAKLDDLSELQAGAFDIPTSKSLEFIKDPDLSICPGLSFDDDKNRLGYGGGFYDRFLRENKTTKIGLMISDFRSIKIPADPWDIKMDFIITEDKIF